MRYERRRLKRVSRTATLGGLFLSFLKVGLTGFGGGLAVIAQIRTLTVFTRDWLTDREFAEGFALAQSLPGTNSGNTVTYIGLRLRGVKGACVAMVGFILPSMMMMIALAVVAGCGGAGDAISATAGCGIRRAGSRFWVSSRMSRQIGAATAEPPPALSPPCSTTQVHT